MAHILSDVVRSWRRLAQLTAIVLLTWTAIDLSFPECCLAETLLVGSLGTSVDTTSDSSPDAPPVDDCFCCAQCIDTGIRSQPLGIETIRTSFSEPPRMLAAGGTHLDHPPQNA